MKITIPVSIDHEKDRDIIEVLDAQSNRSAYIREAIRFYEAKKNGNGDRLEQMMEKILERVQDMSTGEAVIMQQGISPTDVNTENQPKIRGVTQLKKRAKEQEEKKKEEAAPMDDELEEIANNIDSFGKV